MYESGGNNYVNDVCDKYMASGVLNISELLFQLEFLSSNF